MHDDWICAIFLLQGMRQLLVYFWLFDLQRQSQVEVSVENLFEVESERKQTGTSVAGTISAVSRHGLSFHAVFGRRFGAPTT